MSCGGTVKPKVCLPRPAAAHWEPLARSGRRTLVIGGADHQVPLFTDSRQEDSHFLLGLLFLLPCSSKLRAVVFVASSDYREIVSQASQEMNNMCSVLPELNFQEPPRQSVFPITAVSWLLC